MSTQVTPPVSDPPAQAPIVTTPAAPPGRRSDTLAIVGWITAFLMPLVGLVIGLILMNRETGTKRGAWIAGVSVAISILFLIWVIFNP